MGSKKRGPSSVEGEEVVVEGEISNEKAGLSKKNKKGKDKKLRAEGGGSDGPSTPVPSSTKPMERRKKRKLLDKVRHSSAVESKEIKPVQQTSLSKIEDPGTTNGQPVLHIEVFTELASADASKREAAAEKLAVELQEIQRFYGQSGSNDAAQGRLQLEAAKDDGLDNCAQPVRYAVRRLIRGVSSSRECARQGFALGLTILVNTNSKIRVDSILKLIVDSLEVTSSMKGQEVRDCLLGRLFAYGAIARSGRLKEEWISDRNTPYIKDFTSHLIALASKKRYLQEPAVLVLLNLMEMLPKEAVVNHILVAPELREWFEGATSVGNPDALLLAIKIQQKIASDSTVFGNLLPHPFSPSRFFTVDHLTSVANCLKESTFCQPRVHGIWPLLLNLLLPDTVLQDANSSSSLSSTKKNKKSRRSSSSDEDIVESLRCFCEVILEGALLTSSHDRKHLAFDVLLLMLPRLPASHIPIVLSHKFVQGLMDILSTKDSWLYKVAEHFLKEMLDWVGSDDMKRVFVVVALQKHSGGRFDCITRTKTIKDLIAGFTTESGCMLFMQKLTSMFVNEDYTSDESSDQSQTIDDNSEIGLVEDKDSNDRSTNSDLMKSWIVESLPTFLKHLTLDPEAKFRVQKEVMKFLAVQGLFSASLGTEVTSFELQEKFEWPKTPISSALCKMCIDQLQLLLSIAQKAEGTHILTNSLETNDLCYYFMRFLGTLCTIPSVSLVRPLSNEDEKAFKKLQSLESSLSREERNFGLSADANKLHALRYLLIQLLLQLLLRPGEFTEAASELIICCRKAFSVLDAPESSGEDEAEDGESPELIDVLVDTLLSLLPQSSAPLRSAVEQVFRYFCNDVTDDGLLRMLRVIKKDLKPARRKDADGVEGSDDDDDDLLDIEEAEESDEADTVETGLVTDNTEASVRADASDDELSGASDEDDYSDDNMDDEAMFRMDSYLAKIFQERKNQAGGDTAHAQLVLFKLRVLSLLEIYLHENPGSSRVLTVYSNLVQAFVNPSTTEGSEQLAQRIWGIVQKKIFKAKDYPKSEDVQLTTLEGLLEKSLRLASRPFRKKKTAGNVPQKKSFSWNRYKMINSLAQQSTYWLLKVIEGRKISESDLNAVFESFKEALTKYFETKKSQLKPEFLKEVFKRRPWVARQLFGFLVEKCADAKSDYRRVEALELVLETLKSESEGEASKTFLKAHTSKLSHLIKQLARHMPEKQSRRADVRKFCSKVFQIISTHNMTKSFLKTLEPDDHAACETHFGESFLALKK
ncbi:myb-binding protein 1A-like protein [Chenopodium quinoa]|uniref:myb-binding protein 1A-like protein n=1 Tax=Chenopodium quinoa TaxID=63459 RepID=UPI000B76DA7C|nr:myb-binding protein 1A-like protein [Chenopodium quinoa]